MYFNSTVKELKPALVITIFMVGSHLTPGGLLRPNAEGGLLRVKLRITVLWGPMPCVAVVIYWYYFPEDMMVNMTMNIT
jgi:hypothetical protein